MKAKSARKRNPKAQPQGIPPWLAAFCLLLAVICAWLLLRRVIPAPEIWRLPLAVVAVCLGLAAWWPMPAGPFARGKSLRSFGPVDFGPLVCVVLGGMLMLAALIGWGARPLEMAADRVSDLVWGDPDAEKEKPPPDEEKHKAGQEHPDGGDSLAAWNRRTLPTGSDGASRPDAPPLILTFQRQDDMTRWKSRTIYVRVAALEVAGPFGSDWSPLPVEPMVLEDAADGSTDGFVENPESVAGAGEAVPWSIFIPTDTAIVPSLLGMEKLAADAVTRQGAAIWSLGAPQSGFAGSSRPLLAGNNGGKLPDNPVFPARPQNDPLLALPADRAGDLVRSFPSDFDRNLSFRDLVASVPIWLARRCRYSAVYSNPNELPPLIDFLEIGRTGICEHFAASGVLLFRALGIPSRIAYGYAGGTLAESSRMVTYGAKDFHAWAEILVPGMGWVAVECTPPGQGAARPPYQEDETPPEPPPPPAQEQDAPPDWKKLAGTAGSGLALFLLAWLAAHWRLRARARDLASSRKDSSLPQPAWFQAFLDASARLGAPRRHGRTAREHLDFLRRARIADSGIEDLVAEYHLVRYDGCGDGRAREMEEIVASWLDRHREMIPENGSRPDKLRRPQP